MINISQFILRFIIFTAFSQLTRTAQSLVSWLRRFNAEIMSSCLTLSFPLSNFLVTQPVNASAFSSVSSLEPMRPPQSK
ncbi:hypothetical protein NB724_000272 [Pantoea ananatis]|uniref:Uncharacterized protein n=1 Tax=Pantoea ananas TaxID=553 RepID=A0AAJ1CWW8_PANAN|nr:hypothetical protein [Pantoea ananatis]MCW0333310.1 hypothetical protein [Pantoea ananatis]MCW0343057.1 hypothetical protein [Pantoea ananatis]MCW0381440.1 hypothetical protein [Pantoea ananatis]MCW0406105.1 hypothetical protein [Pantoea ananatis]